MLLFFNFVEVYPFTLLQSNHNFESSKWIRALHSFIYIFIIYGIKRIYMNKLQQLEWKNKLNFETRVNIEEFLDN